MLEDTNSLDGAQMEIECLQSSYSKCYSNNNDNKILECHFLGQNGK